MRSEVHLEIRCTNQRGDVTSPGTAVVLLPSREHGAVALPEPPVDSIDGDARVRDRPSRAARRLMSDGRGYPRRMDTIIVGANESETAAKAVDRAAEVAAHLGARLVVVTAFDVDDLVEFSVGDDSFAVSTATRASTFAENTAARLRSTYDIDASGTAAAGKPERVILDAAKQYDASIIVVGNVRMQGAGRLLGSVANDVAHHVPCDVLIVKTV